MLTAADLADFDAPRLATLRVQVQNMAVRQDRYRREALSLGVSSDNPETYRLIQCAERDAEVLADLERLIALAIRFAADESTRRPAPVLRLVPRTEPASPAPPSAPSARGLVQRALAAISGARSEDRTSTQALAETHRLTAIETGRVGS